METSQNSLTRQDEYWMRLALQGAEKARRIDEVPVGAVLVAPDGQTLLAKGFNRRESWATPIGHAELITLHRASQKMQAWRILDTTLYVTLEPCVMCAGALVQARVKRVVFGARDPKGGAVRSLFQVLEDGRLNHRCEVHEGVLRDECSEILTNYFREKRKSRS